MVDELDVSRSAQTPVAQHGDKASIHAAMRADELLDQGDLDGAATWRRIIAARGLEAGREASGEGAVPAQPVEADDGVIESPSMPESVFSSGWKYQGNRGGWGFQEAQVREAAPWRHAGAAYR